MCLAIPGQIVEMSDTPDLGVVEVSGVRRRIHLGLIAEEKPGVGDWVLIHVGFAMSRISEQDAADQMRMLRMLGEDAEAMQEIEGYSE